MHVPEVSSFGNGHLVLLIVHRRIKIHVGAVVIFIGDGVERVGICTRAFELDDITCFQVLKNLVAASSIGDHLRSILFDDARAFQIAHEPEIILYPFFCTAIRKDLDHHFLVDLRLIVGSDHLVLGVHQHYRFFILVFFLPILLRQDVIERRSGKKFLVLFGALDLFDLQVYAAAGGLQSRQLIIFQRAVLLIPAVKCISHQFEVIRLIRLKTQSRTHFIYTTVISFLLIEVFGLFIPVVGEIRFDVYHLIINGKHVQHIALRFIMIDEVVIILRIIIILHITPDALKVLTVRPLLFLFKILFLLLVLLRKFLLQFRLEVLLVRGIFTDHLADVIFLLLHLSLAIVIADVRMDHAHTRRRDLRKVVERIKIFFFIVVAIDLLQMPVKYFKNGSTRLIDATHHLVGSFLFVVL